MLLSKEVTVASPVLGSFSYWPVLTLLQLSAALLILFFYGAAAPAGNHSSSVEERTGTVIAYDYVRSLTPCHRGKCEGSLIVRIDGPDRRQPQYIRVDFKYSQGKPPRQLVLHKRQWRFQLMRTRNLDEPISEFIKYERDNYSKEREVPMWRLIPGAESEKLPFGQVLNSYSLLKNGFKAVSDK